MRKIFCNFSFFKCYGSGNEYVIWCLKCVVDNSYKIMRCYDKEDDKANLRSYRDDVLDIAYCSRKEGKLLCIDFDERLISQYDKARGTFYPMALKHNVNAWNDINVIVETIPELCGLEDQSKEVEGYIEEIRNTFLSKNFSYDIRELRGRFRVTCLHISLPTGMSVLFCCWAKPV